MALADGVVEEGQPATVVGVLDGLVEVNQVFTKGRLEKMVFSSFGSGESAIEKDSLTFVQFSQYFKHYLQSLLAGDFFFSYFPEHPIGYFFEFTCLRGE